MNLHDKIDLAYDLEESAQRLENDVDSVLDFKTTRGRIRIDSDKTRRNLREFDDLIDECEESATVLYGCYMEDKLAGLTPGTAVDEKEVLALLNGLSTTVEALGWCMDVADKSAGSNGGFIIDSSTDWLIVCGFDDYMQQACNNAYFYLVALASYFQYQK